MADQDPQQQSRSALASTWPNPPPFFHDFTDENLTRFREFAETHAAPDDNDDAAAPVRRIPDVPADLTNMQPPAEPEDGKWRVFGDHYSVRVPPATPQPPSFLFSPGVGLGMNVNRMGAEANGLCVWACIAGGSAARA